MMILEYGAQIIVLQCSASISVGLALASFGFVSQKVLINAVAMAQHEAARAMHNAKLTRTISCCCLHVECNKLSAYLYHRTELSA
eukprot:2934-Heterococcus_DN1.PRE.2